MSELKNTYLELIHKLFKTFKTQNYHEAASLLSPEFKFTSPYNDAIDKTSYFESCWPNAHLLQDLTLERIMIDGPAAFVSYEASTSEGIKFRNTEFFSFEGDQISSIEVYFGAAYQNGIFSRMR
ncbi:DUF4440 domain-containing protein [bacterium (Candidatus Blackallbacteria) CG17_big_fil_post_rev_8_21_14_2_50_48_46]|uniref:DUF4440 domain-containing protein n=1 Tax=bacterium (Candidatus Blackallbacteria) CG17_big_fil_post_rev_8_21_14_2_50_48_46 TaxID=2014261 RepID=A0A2M7FZN6_9BACT|nr:MAG: DUF4440 domain-containing protein [bacterium (Candidatus Blackallbacteria) CG18_big_fil_WC_8_21_14_2_50_49_26]PIW14755.1 MAG: DUF4440 domain-containing protein [bacterium (Candidatus Blackallbacteria) CG17_big_fil_post_rev_8_21_14_2_50_48_46]PIW50857.1 MAG: DUF4440 domain-containing protein [bacterium (Candidatus Blackallbacteria) CG13_big_fil_rev_8_21_14_2_50_49_14]